MTICKSSPIYDGSILDYDQKVWYLHVKKHRSDEPAIEVDFVGVWWSKKTIESDKIYLEKLSISDSKK